MAKGISKPSKYAVEWKKVRQTRIKSSGMTALLERLDKQWAAYDGPNLVKNDTSQDPLVGIQQHADQIEKAKSDVSGLASKFTKDFDKKEKEFIKDFLADMDHELNFWKETKRNHLLAGASAETAHTKLTKTNDAYLKAYDHLQTQAKKLETIYQRLHDADKLGDHSAPKPALAQFAKSVEEFQALWTDADDRNSKRERYARQVLEAHAKANAPELHKLIKTIGTDYSADRRDLNVKSTDAKIWLSWAHKQLQGH